MNLLFTGTTGFVGRNLKEYFQDRYPMVYCPRRQDLNLLDAPEVSDYLSRKVVDVIIHCAITTTSVEQNLKMYFNLEKCSDSFGKMICIGSGAEYGMNHYIPKMKEEYFGQHIPDDLYGFSKFVIAKNVEMNLKNIVNLRLFGIYGKYEDYKRRFISNNICRVLCNFKISITQNMMFDYLYVDDFCRILELFIENDSLQRSYNICTGRPLDLLMLAEIIKKVDGKGLPISIKEEGFKKEYSGDNSRFLQEYGPFVFTPPEKAIDELYGWYKNLGQALVDIKE